MTGMIKAISAAIWHDDGWRSMVKVLPVTVFVAVVVLASVSGAGATVTKTVITATQADTASMTLFVEGVNMPAGSIFMGRVGGGVERLEILSRSTSLIEARLLTDAAGTYLVALATPSRQKVWTSTVTIGEEGLRGPAGPPGVSGYSYNKFADFATVEPGKQENFLGICTGGKKIISGGWQETTSSGDLVSTGSYPASDFSWMSRIKNTGTVSRSFSFYYICANVAP